MKRSLFALLILVILTACGSSPNGLKADDLAAVKAENKEALQYGMSRTDVEKILGEGEEGALSSRFREYESGITTLYRDDRIVLIYLSEDSAGVFKTKSGAEIGMTKDQIIKLYGKEHSESDSDSHYTYFYDSKNKKYLKDVKNLGDDSENIYVVSFSFNDDGKVKSIGLSDAIAILINE